MSEAQTAAVSSNVVHIPTVLGAVVVTYNLPSLGNTRLKFDGTVLVDIFMGRITKWNDRRIAALNPGVNLPNMDLIVVHRSDGRKILRNDRFDGSAALDNITLKAAYEPNVVRRVNKNTDVQQIQNKRFGKN